MSVLTPVDIFYVRRIVDLLKTTNDHHKYILIFPNKTKIAEEERTSCFTLLVCLF